MTVLYAYVQTDLDSVKFDYWYDPDPTADQILNFESLGSDYEYDYHLLTSGNDVLSFYGSGFAYDGEEYVSQGTIEDVTQWGWDPILEEFTIRWEWDEWDTSMNPFFLAASTADTADDFAFLEELLSGGDRYYLSDENDVMSGFKGRDQIYGYEGDDRLYGNQANDYIDGGDGDDYLGGGKGHDELFGGAGDDIIEGHTGRDTIRGGEGRDKLYGNEDADVFLFESGDNKDVIKDFELNVDKIDLSYLDFSGSWQDFKSQYLRRADDDTWVNLDDGDRIIIQNVFKPDLDIDDFILS